MTWYIYAIGIIVIALLTLGALDRLGVELPGPLSWIGGHAWAAAAALAGLATGLLLRGRQDYASDAGKADLSDSELPDRPSVDEVEPSDDVAEQVGGAADAVDDDGLEGSLADEVSEQAGKLEEVRE